MSSPTLCTTKCPFTKHIIKYHIPDFQLNTPNSVSLTSFARQLLNFPYQPCLVISRSPTLNYLTFYISEGSTEIQYVAWSHLQAEFQVHPGQMCASLVC